MVSSENKCRSVVKIGMYLQFVFSLSPNLI